MNQVLSILELLDLVFSFVDRASNVNNARVCKQWSDVALDALWHEVDDVLALFNILVPIKDKRKFSWTPNIEDWARFIRYTRRVRRLRIEEKSGKYYKYIFDAVAVTRTSLILFPNLHTLEYISASTTKLFDYCALFMQDSVKQFVATIPAYTGSSCSRLVKDITSRMPYLIELDLRPRMHMSLVEADIIQLLQGLPKLTKVIFLNHHLTGPIVEVLSRLENLGTIQLEDKDEDGGEDEDEDGNIIRDKADVENFSPVLAEGAFPSLRGLSLSVNLADAISFFQQSFAPTKLTALHIGPPIMFQDPHILKEFLFVVSNSCQMLKKLVLVLLGDAELRLNSADDKVIDFNTLRPLVECSNLTCFELTHEYPVKLSLEELGKFARNWPLLEVLLLNCEPVAIQTPALGLSAFLPFAEHCPNLRHLGLFIHASTKDMPSLKHRKLFESLQKLSMGVSDISDEGRIALFLGELCPTISEVKCAVGRQGSLAEIKRRCQKWEEVGKLLPLLVRMHLEAKEHSRALALEVEDLRARNRILMETSGL